MGFTGLETLECRALLSVSTQIISLGPNDVPGTNDSLFTSISADGRFVAFSSSAPDLVPNDTNNVTDIFVFDRQTQTTQRVDVASDGTQANDGSFGPPAISGDGRFVAFFSNATNLVPETNTGGVFVFDRQTNTTELISGNGAGDYLAISGDGRFVSFTSSATDLVTGDTNNENDVFVFDRQTRTTQRVSIASDGSQGVSAGTNSTGSSTPSISSDGRFVAYASTAANLVPGDTNFVPDNSDFGSPNDGSDIFVFDRQTGTTQRVSAASDGAQATDAVPNPLTVNLCYEPSISANGRFVTYASIATNLVPGDTNDSPDIFVFDRQTGTTQRVSVASNGVQANNDSSAPAISADGRYVAFYSSATNLVPNDTDGEPDVFVYDRQTETTRLVAVVTTIPDFSNINVTDFDLLTLSLSQDGQFLSYSNISGGEPLGSLEIHEALAADLQAVGTNHAPQIADQPFTLYEHRANGTSVGTVTVADPDLGDTLTFSITSGNAGNAFVIDQMGVLSVTNSAALDFVTHPIFDLTVRVTDSGGLSSSGLVTIFLSQPGGSGDVIRRVSVTSDGVQAGGVFPFSDDPSVSADGRFVAFTSDASNLVPDDTNDSPDIFIVDRTNGAIQRASVDANGAQLTDASSSPSISGDGRFVAFEVSHTGGALDVLLYDTTTGTSKIISGPSDGTHESGEPSISNDGRFVAFDSIPIDASSLAVVNVFDRLSQTVQQVSNSFDGSPLDGHSGNPSISADGRFISFDSDATNLVPGDTNNQLDVFVFDRETQKTRRVSVASDGTQGNDESLFSSISGNGQFVTYASFATNLAPDDTDGHTDAFVYDLASGVNQLIADNFSDHDAVDGDNGIGIPSISSDGRFVAFNSDADNLVPGDTNGNSDVFVYDRTNDTTHLISVAADGSQGVGLNDEASISADGRFVAFYSDASNLVPGDTNAVDDVFVVGLGGLSNHAPTDLSLSSNDIPENQPGGTTVGTFTTTDPDAGDTFTYALVSGDGATDNASFAISGDTLQTVAPFNFETKSIFSIRVRSTDSSGHPFEKILSVGVTNVNEAPNIVSNGFKLPQHSANGTVVGTVSASDPDVGDTRTFAITAGNTGDAFAIDPITGILTVNNTASLDINANAIFNLSVQVTDGGGLTSTANVFVGVVAQISNSKLNVTSPNGTQITFALTKGTAAVSFTPDGKINLNITGAGASINITSKNPTPGVSNQIFFNSVTVSGVAQNLAAASLLAAAVTPVGSFIAKSAIITGTFDAPAGLKTLTLASADGATINIGPASDPKATLAVTIGTVKNTSLNSQMPLKSITAVNWLDDDATADTITAPLLGSLKIAGDKKSLTAGDFQAGLTLTGAAGVPTTLGTVSVAGALGSGDAQNPDVWNITGAAKSIMGGVTSGLSLTGLTALATLKLGRVASASISGTADLGAVSAIEWLAGTIDARSVKSVKIAGDAKNAIRGDFDAALSLTGTANVKIKQTLGAVTAAGLISGATWTVRGPVGAIAAARLIDSTIYVGIDAGVVGLPATADDLDDTDPLASIKSLTLKGIKGSVDPDFVNSIVAARTIGPAALGRIATQNSGTAFGLAAHTLGPVTSLDVNGKKIVRTLLPDDDFLIRVI